MDLEQIQNLEQHYQVLYSNFQAGKIDETTFIAEVDKLQFQDEWGRYWMMGTQTGSWHYYDGQDWHQADPREADKLPFMDDQGRYWQRGVKSGDWYYYHPETGEWVKPGEGDALAAPTRQRAQPGQNAGYVPYRSHLQPQSVDTGPGMPNQLDGELFQDDEGRYWAIGAKTGQWYFYDQNGWHPAHEFQQQITPRYAPQYQTQPFQPPYSPAQPYDSQFQSAGPGHQQPAQSYVVQPTQPGYQQPTSPTQPIQIYITSPGQEMQSAGGQPNRGEVIQPHQTAAQQPTPQDYATSAGQAGQAPATHQATPAAGQAGPSTQPASAEPDTGPMPKPPKDRTESGSWYYFDGEQWLQYSTGEPEATPPPSPKMVIDQVAKPSKPKAETKEEQPVVAEFLEEDEPPVEVVDVEVITVLEAEPEPTPKPEPEPEPPSREFAPRADDIRPRRASQPTEIPRRAAREPMQPQTRRSRDRTPSEPRPVMPRKKETAHEPTFIIPTESAASQISAPALPVARAARPGRPSPGERRRAREDTVPMEVLKGAEADGVPPATHRGVTQPMPTTAGSAARAEKAQAQAVKSAKQRSQQKAETIAAQPEKSGFTVGDVFRSIPSTVWTFAGGVVLLLGCAFGLIFVWSWLQGGELNPGGLAAIPSLTPTLDAGPPDTTPTPGPTATTAPELAVTATPASLAVYSNADLGFSVEYPETWQTADDELCASFAPSTAGLDRDNPQDAGIWICNSADSEAEIADLLTEVLADFPPDAETLNEGTISIASQTWTSAQIRYDAEDFGGQGIATLAVTNKDGTGYYLVALAPAEEWNSVQPLFQAMINSFSFSTRAIAQASSQAQAEENSADEGEQATPDSASTRQKSTTEADSAATPRPKGTATPLVYTVQAGDTLLGIALKFGVDADLLAAKNEIDDPASLQVGQELVIPFTAEELEAFNAGQSDVAGASPSEAGEEPSAAGDETGTPVAETPAPAGTPEPEAPASTEAATVSGRIVYPAFNPGTNIYDLWMADIATGEQTVIAVEASQPAFNRDGSLLAYRSWNLGTRGIFFRDFVGGRGGQVTRFVEDGLPTWSPDGYSFAFASRREGDRVSRIFVGNQLGEGDYGIGFQGEYPATFPDGRLVVKGCSPQGDCGLYVMGASGGGDTKISGDPGDTAPAVSPDGSKIAFMSSGRGATNWEIWVMNADGSNPQRLTQNGSNEGLPAWSPDGQSIAYVSDQGGVWAIWVMNTDGSNQRKLFNMNGSPDGQVLHDVNNSKGWVEERISWAP